MAQKRPTGNGHLLPAAPIAAENAGGRGVGGRGRTEQRRGRRSPGRRRAHPAEHKGRVLRRQRPPLPPGPPAALPRSPAWRPSPPPTLRLGRYLPLPEGFRKSRPRARDRERDADNGPPRPEGRSPGGSPRAARTSVRAARTHGLGGRDCH